MKMDSDPTREQSDNLERPVGQQDDPDLMASQANAAKSPAGQQDDPDLMASQANAAKSPVGQQAAPDPSPVIPDEAEYPAELTEHYELLECFAAEEETQTLLASDRTSGELCVVKCWMKGSVFFRHEEPEALRTLHTPPCPRFLAEYRNEQMRCVVREYVPGDTLDQLARTGGDNPFTEEDVIRIGTDLCDQLHELHTQEPPVIHRDIKPQNVVIRPDGKAVLIDFGISRVQTDKDTDTVAFGTQGFAPPEQYGFARTDARSDIYSLGMLLYWLLHRDTRIPSEVSSPLEKVLQRCTAFDPQKRYPDVLQVKKALQNSPFEVKKGRIGKIVVGVVFALAVLVSLILVFVNSGKRAAAFKEPLIEAAARMNLQLGEEDVITEDMLSEVKALYIVADAAYPDSDSFYSAIGQWYAGGKSVRGPLASLEDLEQMTELEEVCIVAQELEDISVLANLPELKKAECKHNDITDISPLAGLKHLTSVGINDNPVQDISPLQECPNLTILDLCDVRNYDPAVIATLGNFDFLDISNSTRSYEYLEGKSIRDLRIAWSDMSDLTVLDQVNGLERLEINHSNVTDLTPLQQHTGLKYLRISGLAVKDLQVLLTLPQLEEVVISEDMMPLTEALGEPSFKVTVE